MQAKIIERTQKDGWKVAVKANKHWQYITSDQNDMVIFGTKEIAQEYLADALPEYVIVEIAQQEAHHHGHATKPRVDLIDPSFQMGLARVLSYGAKKYSPDNWRYGSKWSKRYASAQRHMLEWQAGNDVDEETGENHLYHAAANIMILAYWQFTGRGKDDRKLENLEADTLET